MLTSFSVSLASGNTTWAFETILLFASALELLYLGIMPRQERFRRAVRSREAAEHDLGRNAPEIVFCGLSRHAEDLARDVGAYRWKQGLTWPGSFPVFLTGVC